MSASNGISLGLSARHIGRRLSTLCLFYHSRHLLEPGKWDGQQNDFTLFRMYKSENIYKKNPI